MATAIRSFNRLVLCLASILFIFTQQSSAKILDVGGALGWTDFDTAISAAPNYDIWSSEHTINVGDVLVFSFPAGYQNVYLMSSKSAHESCDFSQATELDAGNAGTYAWRATKKGTYYFSCNKVVEGLGTHCEAGQKLEITVTAGSTQGSSTSYTSLTAAEIKPVSYLEQRFSRYMFESLAVAPVVAPVSSPVPVPVGAPVPSVAGPALAPTPSPALLPIASPPAPPSVPTTSPASAPAKSAGDKVSAQAFAGVLTATLALVALWW
ncbi:unnamed protein product [Sphagnum compactum]